MPEGEAEVCKQCGQPIAPEDRVMHHLSYEPETTIPMHRICHSTMHSSKSPSELKPTQSRPNGFVLPKDTTAITVYIKIAKLDKLDKLCGPIPRNKYLNKLIDDLISGEFEIDWRE